MTENRDIMTTRPSNGFGGYTSLLAQVKRRVLLAQRRAIYAANEEMLRMYWDIGELLQSSQKADGWGKSTLQRLANDMKNEFPEIKGFSVRNMQCMVQFYNEYNKELTMVKGKPNLITQPTVAQLHKEKDLHKHTRGCIKSPFEKIRTYNLIAKHPYSTKMGLIRHFE